MVSSKRGFSHISVSADDEDDLVIEAGAPEPSAGAGSAAPEPDRMPRPAAEAADGGRQPAAGEGGAAADASEALAPSAAEPPPSPAESARQYDGGAHRTSLEDLQDSKMGAVQKTVIALAAIGLVAFAIYYLFFM